MYDARTSSWSEELCSDLNVPLEVLPEIVEPWKVIGTVDRRAAKESGLATGTAIVAGAGDQAACFLGAGVVHPGLVVDVAGTASVLACCVTDYRPDLTHKTLFFPQAVVPGLWYPHAFIRGGGLCLRWFRDNIVKPERDQIELIYSILDEAAKNVPAGSDSLFFIPHLGGRQSPYHNEVRGVWAGLSWGHDQRHLYKSILESIAFEYCYYLKIERSLFPEVEFKEIRVFGGGSKSEVFNQIKANILGIPYVQLNRDEVGELGSAIIAGYGIGLFKDMVETTDRFVAPWNRIEPDMKIHKVYQSVVEVYTDLIERLDPFFDTLSNLGSHNPEHA